MSSSQQDSMDHHNPKGAQGSGVDRQAPMSGYKTAKKDDADDWVAGAAGLPHAEGQTGSMSSEESGMSGMSGMGKEEGQEGSKGVGMGKEPGMKMGEDLEGRGSG
ncbi:Protein of unknown function [Pyronema omphalodes CBS 100304]|uniref:Uncharacterized protein n=1 Tax=Pyronema omphalodes (strain CBS 100304) TaxID=1076935 RepID=U4L1S8_PYROM|nr:Protein of unknown function [Pyronema omphalodes CBS 100304]